MNRPERVPRYRELPTAGGEASAPRVAWGLHGPSDELGAVARLQPEVVQRAASLVRWGSVFSHNWPLNLPDPPLLGDRRYRHVELELDEGTDDYLDELHPRRSTHWRALRSLAYPGLGFYNGLTLEDVHDLGARRLGIEHWAAHGIVGRFVLVDLQRHRAALGKDLGEPADSLDVDQVDDVLSAQGVELDRGDILLLRFGWTARYERLSAPDREALASGALSLGPGPGRVDRTVEWLWDHGVVAVAADVPSLEQAGGDARRDDLPLQRQLVACLGMPVGAMFYLEELAHDCATNGVYEGLFVSSPLHIPGGSSSPANAIALK